MLPENIAHEVKFGNRLESQIPSTGSPLSLSLFDVKYSKVSLQNQTCKVKMVIISSYLFFQEWITPSDVGIQILIQKLIQKLTESCKRSFSLLLHVMVGVSIFVKAIHQKWKSQFAGFLKVVLPVSTLVSSLRRCQRH